MGVSILEGQKAERIAAALESMTGNQSAINTAQTTANQALTATQTNAQSITGLTSGLSELQTKVDNINATDLKAVSYEEQALTNTQKAQARANIGLEDIDSLTTGNIKYDQAQTLTDPQKAQTRTNIGAASASEVDTLSEDLSSVETDLSKAITDLSAVKTDLSGAVNDAANYLRTDKDQTLNDSQKGHVLKSIGLDDINELVTGTVKYDVTQTLTDEQKSTARANIGLDNISELVSGTVKYDTDQTEVLTTTQKLQARQNIGAAASGDISDLSDEVGKLSNTVNDLSYVKDLVNEEGGGITATLSNNSTKTLATGLDFNGGYVDENNYLHLRKGETDLSEDLYTPIQLPTTGGGGGVAGSVISVSGIQRVTAVRNGAEAQFSFYAEASDASDITAKWYVNDVQYATDNGTTDETGTKYSFDAKDYLRPSDSNYVKVVLESVGGGTLTRRWAVASVAFSVEWGGSIEPVMLYTANANIYTQIIVSAEANSNNIVTVKVGTNTVTRNVTGSQTLTIALDRSWFASGENTVTASMVNADNPDDKADDIHFVAIWGYNATQPTVAFAEDRIECKQYDVVDIDYFIYDPDNETATYTLIIGDGDPRTMSAGREKQTYRYSPMNEETITITLSCGAASDTVAIEAGKSDYNLSYYTDDSLLYDLNPMGHSNSDGDRASFGGITFSDNFDWTNGGFQTDENGVSAFVVKKGSRATLPRSLFEDDDSNGKTIDLSFKVVNSDKYDAVAIQDMDNAGTIGLKLYANNGEIYLSSTAGQEFRYCEESRIDMSILVESNQDYRLSTVWLDGIPSKATAYTANMLVQEDNHTVIGSDNCDVWVYNIRVYNSGLSTRQMIQNYISNGNTNAEKVARYTTNNILDTQSQEVSITPADLHRAAPNLTIIQISASRMTTSKSDPVPADITITDGATVLELAAASGPETGDGTVFKVQGTSSAAYGRSAYNMDLDFKGTGKKYKLDENAIAVNYLNIKVNVASAENANNVCAVDWYNTYEPYLTESRKRPGVRDTVQGKPCAVFFTNTASEDVWFSSQKVAPGKTILYAMGDLCNSKKNTAVFGQDGLADEYVTHPTKACIEVSGNDTEPQRFRSTDFQFYPEADDGKGRWETRTTEDGKSKTQKQFEWRMKPSNADKDEVVESWNKAVAWVVSTMGNSAKFKEEVGNYFAINSLLYHFLFLEYFACYDNVSKNTFYSYDWDESAQKYLWNIKAAYDMDTILACDNDGKPLGDYGLDYGDRANETQAYFNADTNPIWVNIQDAYYNELSSLYTSLRAAGAWNSTAIMDKWNNFQDQRPHAAMILDAYNKYIKPYKTTGVKIGTEIKDSDNSYLPRCQGSKIYWRRQFLTYQTAYMDGKYGYYNKGDAMQFRTNGEASTRNYAIKAYAKTYITIIADDNRVGSQKVGSGEVTTFNNVSVGNNTTMYITPDRLIQYVRPLDDTQNSTFSASGASKLTEAILGGETINNSWPADTGVTIPSQMLQDFSIRNMPSYSQDVNLSGNVALETVDTRGTKAGLITLPAFAPLKTVQLNACTGIVARDLKNVETFTMESGSNLTSIRTENCNTTVSEGIKDYLTEAAASNNAATRRIRAIGVDWRFDNLDTLYKIAESWKGYNALGAFQDVPVVTGEIHVTQMSEAKIQTIHKVWGSGELDDALDKDNREWTGNNLKITYDSSIPYYPVTFVKDDGDPVLDKNGNEYIQYIDRDASAYDPVEAGEINTPTRASTDEYVYTFSGWSNLGGQVRGPKTVTANFSYAVRSYTVRWYDKPRSMLKETANVIYGSEVTYSDDPYGFPTLADEEGSGVYKVFAGWDKSTGFITGDTDVYAIWESAVLPETGKDLKDMSVGEINAVVREGKASTLWDEKDYTDIVVGKDFNFSNVESQVIAENLYLDGTGVTRTGIKLFSADAPSFTLAIDYEFSSTTSGGTLAGCYNEDGSQGFRLYMSNNNPTIQWGNSSQAVGAGMRRGIVVIRHIKGSSNLYIASDNPGNNTYNANILTVEVPRAQFAAMDESITFGGIPVGASSFDNAATGLIHWCKIWYQNLGQTVIGQLASWPHETWRMEYTGLANSTNRYSTPTEGTSTPTATFVSNSLLQIPYPMFASDSTGNTDGYRSTILRTFINDRCFAALPFSWQAMIKTVRVRSTSSRGLETVTVNDKITIPSYAEMFTGASDPLSQEGTTFPWNTANEKRVRFQGLIIPSDAQYISTGYDPTTLTGTYTIKDGDIWVDTTSNRDTYIYVSAAEAAKHGMLGGRIKTSAENRNATGAQGGIWVKASFYWTRSSGWDGGSFYMWTVRERGSAVYNYTLTGGLGVNLMWTI